MFSRSLNRSASAPAIGIAMMATIYAGGALAQWEAGGEHKVVYGWENLPDGMKLSVVSGAFPALSD